jgi:tight adherence protein C
MKIFIAIGVAVCVGLLASWLQRKKTFLSRPSSDFITNALKNAVGRLRHRRLWGIQRYESWMKPFFDELPLPAYLDLDVFFVLQGFSGILLWILITCAFPSMMEEGLVVCLCAGAFLPTLWLSHQRREFHTALLKALPDCLERLALVLEAGLDLGAALRLYLAKGPNGPLKNILQAAYKDIQLGRSRIEAFEALGQRTSFAPLGELSRSIVQALALGTSLAPLLREQSGVLRLKRMQLAEEKAAQAPIKILFPLFVFIFPSVFIVLLGPIVILFMRGGF